MKIGLTAFFLCAAVPFCQGQETDSSLVYLPVGGVQTADTNAGPLSSAEQLPEYPGGTQALIRFLSRNLVYPSKAVENNVQGTVMVKFVVCEDGTLCNEEITKGLGYGCDEEVLRVVKSMPKWKPGKQDGKAVRVYYSLPVTFALLEDTETQDEKK